MPENMNPLISVIVPVYNAEAWLGVCVESICRQTYEFLEIILIDDGSRDRSLEICREVEARDPRIRVISKANSGVSDTRNLGIRLAEGAYITFVDADDRLRPDILERAVARMEKEAADLVVWNVGRLKGETVTEEPAIQEGPVPCASAITTIVYDSCSEVPLGRYFRASWGKLYAARILKNHHIAFPTEQKIGEDALFLLEYIRHIRHISGINTVGYEYRISDTSAVRRYRTDLLQQNRMQLEGIRAYLEKEPEHGSARMATALTCLAWDMFRRLIRNGLAGETRDPEILSKAKQDAKNWFEKNRGILLRKDISVGLMPRTTRLQYFLAPWVPLNLLIRLSVEREKRKI